MPASFQSSKSSNFSWTECNWVNVESTMQTNWQYTNDYLFIYFAQNKRTVRFQCTRQAETARLKTLTQHKTKKSRLHIAISLFNQIRWQMHIFQGSFEWSKTCEVNRCRQRCWLLTIFIRPPHSRQTQTDKIQPTNTTNTNPILKTKDTNVRNSCSSFLPRNAMHPRY